MRDLTRLRNSSDCMYVAPKSMWRRILIDFGQCRTKSNQTTCSIVRPEQSEVRAGNFLRCESYFEQVWFKLFPLEANPEAPCSSSTSLAA